MQISELKAGTGKVDIVLHVVEKGDVRTFDKYGRQGSVCSTKAKDTSGAEISLTLWNDQITQVNQGNFVKITNGYVGEFKGTLQLSTGKFGTLEVVTGF